MSRVVLNHLTKAYGGGVLAVNNVSLEVADGEFVCLVGPSGMRQDHGAADDQRSGGDQRRRGQDR